VRPRGSAVPRIAAERDADRRGAREQPAAGCHARVANAFQENAYAISEGQRLFNWYNCSGCHANGGGGMGPPLIDDEWIYGDAPENVYETIVQGRPNGMPSFGSHIPTPQVWQIVAYVRSLSGQTPSAARSSRSDHMMNAPGSQSLQKPQQPKTNSRPPKGEMP
jgi:cytochrome c oxidase cbb3-type subunit III